MSDVYSTLAAANAATQARIADVLETRGADAQQHAMRTEFLNGVPFAGRAVVLEVGCGTGVLTRRLARWPGIERVDAVDPVPSLLERARTLCNDMANVSFHQGDGRSLKFGEASYDGVVMDSTLSHVPRAEEAVAEAFRVLRSGGVLAVFDGDYATTTVALGPHDPLQTCVEAMMSQSVNDRFLVRRLPAIARGCGFTVETTRGFSYVETARPAYMLTIIDRGADLLVEAGTLSPAAGADLKAEARRRAESGEFFGHIAYGSLVARKPDSTVT